jgi:GGDEF domain-containing protein
MSDLVMMLIAALLVAIVSYIVSMRKCLARVSVNPNFNVATRVAALESLERRKTGKGSSVIAFDVAGMGKANQTHGEQWVNERIRVALAEVRASLRTTDVIAQLNSGDEFFIVVRSGDELQVMAKVLSAFSTHWDEGIYIASSVVSGNVMSSVVSTMEKVYMLKAVKKGLK